MTTASVSTSGGSGGRAGNGVVADVAALKDRGGAKYMEDDCMAVVTHGDLSVKGVFAVYDGHSMDKKAGRVAARIAKLNTHLFLLRYYNEASRQSGKDVDVAPLFSKAFAATEAAMKKHSKDTFLYAGCTATVAVVTTDSSHGATLHVANVGDSRGFLL